MSANVTLWHFLKNAVYMSRMAISIETEDSVYTVGESMLRQNSITVATSAILREDQTYNTSRGYMFHTSAFNKTISLRFLKLLSKFVIILVQSGYYIQGRANKFGDKFF
jgi:hypothetical protein